MHICAERSTTGWAWILCLLVPCLTTIRSAHGQTPSIPIAEQENVVVRIWGVGSGIQGQSPLLGVLTKLETDYCVDHPGVHFVHHLSGNDSAVGGLYMGAADLSLMDREPSYIELDGYQQVLTGQKPYEVAIMSGGIAAHGHSSPLVIIVNSRNPIQTLSVAQLKSIFSVESSTVSHRQHVWGDLGLKKNWAAEPLHLYGFGVESSEARTFSKLAMDDSRRWSNAYSELYDDPAKSAAQKVADAVAKDVDAIGISTFSAVSRGTKILAVENSSGEAAKPTVQTLASAKYILGRTIVALARMQNDGLVDFKTRSFLSYLVSMRAKTIIAADGSYVPLDEHVLSPERKELR